MKKALLFFILLFAAQGHSFEIRYKMISFGATLTEAFEDLFGKLPDTASQGAVIRSMIATTPCVNNRDTTVKDCWARGIHHYERTTYECCLIRTLGTVIDSLNITLNEKRGMYKNYDAARANLEMSEDIIIREKKYLATLYFTPGELFKGYIIYALFRGIGDDGVRGDLEELDQFMEAKYGKPISKKTNIALPDEKGMAFEYAVWNQQRCTIKLAIVCDGRQIWVQESVLNRKYDESKRGSSN